MRDARWTKADVARGMILARWRRAWPAANGRFDATWRERRGIAGMRRGRATIPHRLPAMPVDTLRFIREWLRNPVGTAAVAPSGRALVSLITRDIGAHSGPVLELGPGTGVFTQALVARGVRESDLTLVELNPTFARMLGRRFPGANILSIDAARLGEVAGGATFGAAVCGLGLRNMSADQVEAILAAAFSRMQPDAPLYLFTYGRRCSVPDVVLDRLALGVERMGTAIRNLPPASVYRLSRLPSGA